MQKQIDQLPKEQRELLYAGSEGKASRFVSYYLQQVIDQNEYAPLIETAKQEAMNILVQSMQKDMAFIKGILKEKGKHLVPRDKWDLIIQEGIKKYEIPL